MIALRSLALRSAREGYMYCCDGLRNMIASAGQSGLAILVRERSSGKIGFVLQSRGVSFDDEPRLKGVAGFINVNMNISADRGIRFCPFCGRKLEDLAKESPEYYIGLAIQHKRILNHMMT
jgi:hypothetical protein